MSEKGFDPDYGARPLKRAIQDYIQNPLSLKILEGDFMDGSVIQADADSAQGLIFKKVGEIER